MLCTVEQVMMPNLKVIITEHKIPELMHSNLISSSHRKICSMNEDGDLIEGIRIKLQF